MFNSKGGIAAQDLLPAGTLRKIVKNHGYRNSGSCRADLAAADLWVACEEFLPNYHALHSTPPCDYRTSYNQEVTHPPMTREHATILIAEARENKKITYERIASAVGRHKIQVTAALLGQATMSAEEAQRVVAIPELPHRVADALHRVPIPAALEETIPKAPLVT